MNVDFKYFKNVWSLYFVLVLLLLSLLVLVADCDGNTNSNRNTNTNSGTNSDVGGSNGIPINNENSIEISTNQSTEQTSIYNKTTTGFEISVSESETVFDESNGCQYRPEGPLVQCSFLPMDFIACQEPVDLEGNQTARDTQGYGCVKFGGQKYSEVEITKVFCTVLPEIECYGNRTFLKDGFPCIKYSGHHFVTTLLYSVLLGFLGIDRFCLGHTGTAVGKLITVGGVGIWWIIDIILLVTGSLVPNDGSNWEPYY